MKYIKLNFTYTAKDFEQDFKVLNWIHLSVNEILFKARKFCWYFKTSNIAIYLQNCNI